MNSRVRVELPQREHDDKPTTIEQGRPVVNVVEDTNTSPTSIASLVGPPTTESIPVAFGVPHAEDDTESREQR